MPPDGPEFRDLTDEEIARVAQGYADGWLKAISDYRAKGYDAETTLRWVESMLFRRAHPEI